MAEDQSKLDQAEERRRANRPRTIKFGKIVLPGLLQPAVDCRIVDLTDRGARLETEVMLAVPEMFAVQLGHDPERQVRRCWARGYEIGVEFL